ncbi:hypothetical protein [Desulfovibrio sp. JC022]|uniref:hypothetical protein n=1 Tax=Desulfovibrio sp. JC022 TaxID=2593642 RepID=UPI0013D7E3B2|nr:hypothetical protein [Desulfovibrio sp. JC022]NDV23303.1 hypothetical protein [Desulfovibrio sp. JC022]
MKKKLIEAGNLDSFVCPDSDTLYVDNTMLLTPGAKDELRKRKISIARVEDAAAAVAEAGNGGCGNPDCTKDVCDECEDLVMGIAVLLKEEYGITDLGQLKEMSFKLAEAVKGNI